MIIDKEKWKKMIDEEADCDSVMCGDYSSEIKMKKISAQSISSGWLGSLSEVNYYVADETDSKIKEYEGDREFFQRRDLEQCRAISSRDKEIERLKAENDALRKLIPVIKI